MKNIIIAETTVGFLFLFYKAISILFLTIHKHCCIAKIKLNICYSTVPLSATRFVITTKLNHTSVN